MQSDPHTNSEPSPAIWLVVVMFLISLGLLAAGGLFLHHGLLAQNPPGTTIVNPFFSLLLLVAGGAGLYSSCAAFFRLFLPRRQDAAPRPAPHPAEISPVPASPGRFLACLFWLLGTELKLWLVSLFLVGWGAWELFEQERGVWKWHRTQGVVLESKVASRYLRTEPPRPPLVPRIRYRYEVDGQVFESTQVTTGDPLVFGTAGEAEAFLARHAAGDTVSVLYLPDSPQQATLRVSRDGGGWLLLGFGIPTLAFTAYLSVKRRGGSEPDLDVPVLG